MRKCTYSNRCGGGATPIAERLSARVMSLPMHPDLDETQQDAIVAALAQAIAAH